jgi:hypothetical protein
MRKFITSISIFSVAILLTAILFSAGVIAAENPEPEEKLAILFADLPDNTYEVTVDLDEGGELIIDDGIITLDILDDEASDFNIACNVDLLFEGHENYFVQQPYFTELGNKESGEFYKIVGAIGVLLGITWPFIVALGFGAAALAISAVLLLIGERLLHYGFNDWDDFKDDVGALLLNLYELGTATLEEVIEQVTTLVESIYIKCQHTFSLGTKGASEVSLPGIKATLSNIATGDFIIEVKGSSGLATAQTKYILVHVIGEGGSNQQSSQQTEPSQQTSGEQTAGQNPIGMGI